MHREDEGFDTDDESEDSDYENSSERAGGSAPEVRGGKKEEVKPESFPLLTKGSFARYAYFKWHAQVSDFMTAGHRYFSICTQTPFNLRP